MLKPTAHILFSLLMLAGAPAMAADGSIDIPKAQARATMGKMTNSAAFLQIENKGKTDEALLSATSPVAERVEIHSMTMEGNVMKMRAADSVDIKAGDKIEMKPGQGYHLMLMNLKKPLKAGEKFPLTLTFRKAGKIQLNVDVVEMGMPGKPAGADMHEHHNH